MGIREDVLALADELEGVSLKDDCESCLASGTGLCRGDLECAESAHKACAKRLREIVERDECEVTTVSAYDLLSDEDRKAIAWVREHGGLGAVEKRLMPEGVEWPRYTDGSPVEFGDEVVGPDYGECINVNAVKLNAKRFRLYDSNGCGKWYEREDRFERPPVAADGEPLEVGQTVWNVNNGMEFTVSRLPKPGEYQAVEVRHRNGSSTSFDPDRLTHQRPVLDADGVPIRVGDTVWDIETGCRRTVRAVNDNETVEFDGYENRGWFGCFLTHRAPVLAADGKPIREGETVWHVGNGVEFTVIGLPNPGEYQSVKLRLDDGAFTGFDPDQLTHERPESWERLEHDAEKTVCEYFGANYDCANCPLEPARCDEEAKKDIIRRAKKLAEKGEQQ